MSTAAATDPQDAPPARTFYERMLDGIERAGKPGPASGDDLVARSRGRHCATPRPAA
jgi:hypothetical protein